MRTIHKFEVPTFPGIHEIEVRGFQRWLDAGEQDGRLVIWAEVLDQFSDRKIHLVSVAWTGDEVPDADSTHFRTVQIGLLVHHIYLPNGVSR